MESLRDKVVQLPTEVITTRYFGSTKFDIGILVRAICSALAYLIDFNVWLYLSRLGTHDLKKIKVVKIF